VLAAVKSGSGVKLTMRAGFPVPHGASAGQACKGKLTLTAHGSNHGSVKKAVKLSAGHGTCTALFRLVIPGAKLGTSFPATLSFNGNRAVSAFSRHLHLKLMMTTTSTTPTTTTTTPNLNGDWTATVTDPSTMNPVKVCFTVAGDEVSNGVYGCSASGYLYDTCNYVGGGAAPKMISMWFWPTTVGIPETAGTFGGTTTVAGEALTFSGSISRTAPGAISIGDTYTVTTSMPHEVCSLTANGTVAPGGS
jgi:hypothetical protein